MSKRSLQEEDDFYASVATATPVRLIMTKVRDLLTCAIDDDADEVAGRSELADFDHIPVRTDGQIVGIFDRTERFKSGPVKGSFRPLNARYLIGDRASIFTFIERAHQRCCVVVGERGIVGMVTASDLQKLPVQVALFGLLAQFESLVTTLLRKSLGDPEAKYESVLDLLSPPVAKKARRLQAHNAVRNLSIDWISPLSLGEKLQALQASNPNLMDWTQAARVKDLRDSVAHGKEFAQTFDLIQELVASKRIMVILIDHMRAHLARR